MEANDITLEEFKKLDGMAQLKALSDARKAQRKANKEVRLALEAIVVAIDGLNKNIKYS